MRRENYFSGGGHVKPSRATDGSDPDAISYPAEVSGDCLLSALRFHEGRVHFLLHLPEELSRNGYSHPEARELQEAIRVGKESSHAPSTEPKHPLSP